MRPWLSFPGAWRISNAECETGKAFPAVSIGCVLFAGRARGIVLVALFQSSYQNGHASNFPAAFMHFALNSTEQTPPRFFPSRPIPSRGRHAARNLGGKAGLRIAAEAKKRRRFVKRAADSKGS